MTPDESRLAGITLKLAAELVQRFYISSIYLDSKARHLLIGAGQEKNEILSFCQDYMAEKNLSQGFLRVLIPDSTEMSGRISNAHDLTVIYAMQSASKIREGTALKILLTFDTSSLVTKDKIRFYQRLYGYIKKSSHKGKSGSPANSEAVSTNGKSQNAGARDYAYPGLLEKVQGEKIGKSSILYPAVYHSNVEIFFSNFKVSYRTQEVFAK